MKIMKILLGIIGVILLAYMALGVFGKKNYKVEREILIQAPKEAIWKHISNYNNWGAWSPWVNKDSNAVYTFSEEQGGVGAAQSWEGNEEVGKGSMETTKTEGNDLLEYKLQFIEPWEMQSYGGFTLETVDEGTKVTWTDQGNIPFMQRAFMIFMDMDKMIGPDFELGLQKLKEIAENEKSLAQEYEIKTIDFPVTTYIGKKYKIAFTNLDAELFGNTYQTIGVFLAKNNLESEGMPAAIYFSWDMENGTTEMAPVIPVANYTNGTKLTDELEVFSANATKALEVDYYGPYEESGKAHEAISKYLVENNIEVKGFVIEEYANDPATVNSSQEYLTKIYYLLN